MKWKTIDKSAIAGKDYVGGEGEIQFKHGETQRDIKIPIIDDMDFEKDENFEVEIYDIDNGAKLGKITRTAVTITNDDEFNSVMSRILLMSNANVDEMRVHNETWAQQFKDAMVVNGGDIENASTGDYVMHFLTFGFKVSFQINIFRSDLENLVDIFHHSACRTAWWLALIFHLPDNDWSSCDHRWRPSWNIWLSRWVER